MTKPLTTWQKLKLLMMINNLYKTIKRRLAMPDDNKIPWYGQKTTWAAIVAAIGIVSSYFTGEIGLFPAISAFVGAVGMIFMRQGVEKSKPT